MKKFIEKISCPVTKKILNNPVLTSDNIVYEAEVAHNLIKKKISSPISGKILNEEIKIPLNLKSLIDLFLEENEKFRKLRYSSDFNIKKIYNFSRSEILSIFAGIGSYNNLLKYDNFKLSIISKQNFINFLSYAPTNVIIHFIDNCVNLSYKYDGSDWNIVNYICKYSNSDVVEHILKTYPTLNYENDSNNGWKPIHQIASEHNDKCMNLLLDINVNLFSKTIECISGIEFIIGNRGKDVILKTIGKVDYLKEDIELPYLIIRLEDNENLTLEDKHFLECILISKYN